MAALFAQSPAPAREVIAAAAGSAPYLARCLEQERAWLSRALASDAPMAAVWEGGADTGAALRIAKRRAALVCALGDIAGVWDLAAVTGALSSFARQAVGHALRLALDQVTARTAVPPTRAPFGGLAIFAMGKLGAGELNYSSDIDLIVLFDETAYAPGDRMTARATLVKVTQALVKLLADNTDEGHVFRTDLRLRPDPSVTPICQAMGAAERYYEALGRTWERAAWIKADVAAGDLEAGRRFLRTLQPFVWRRHLDFAAIQDAHDMRHRIRAHKDLGGDAPLEGYDVKLGRGGIREIEFFTQTRQLICGGRDVSLRARGTEAALAALADAGWIERALAEDLRAAYRAHRQVEHRLQMFENAQTHALPKTEAGFARLADLLGAPSVPALRASLQARFDGVAARTEAFFDRSATPPMPSRWDGFADPAKAEALAASWATLPALRSARAQALFAQLQPRLAQALGQGADPDAALVQFDGFLRGLPAGVQVFALFEANPQLLDLMCDICATAPALAAYLGRNAGVLDAVLSGVFFAPLPGVEALRVEAVARLSGEADYEAQLDAARVWQKEHHFRIGVHLLRGLVTAEAAMAAYSALAEASLAALLPAAQAEHARRFGAVPGAALAVLAMGRLGSGEMTARSDLDLIVIYDTPPGAVSDGPRSLAATPYFARLTQTLIAALTAPTAQGTLYQTDMRLRPSGRKGPVAVTLSGFLDYQAHQAWTWEHLALTRARVVAGPPALRARLAVGIASVLATPKPRAALAQDVAEMRARLAREKGGQGLWALKSGAGGLLDVDLMAQSLALDTGAPPTPHPDALLARDSAWLAEPARAALRQSRQLLSRLDLAARLVGGESTPPDTLGPGARAVLARVAGVAAETDLDAQVEAARARAAEIIDAALEGG